MIVLGLEELEQQKDELNAAIKNSNVAVVRSALWRKLREVKDQIEKEEFRQSYQKKMKVIDGVEVEVPCFFAHHENLTYKDGLIYSIDRSKKVRDDGSFSWHHYVYIPSNEKHTSLCIRTFGGDMFGDRYSMSTSYYKDTSNQFSYLSKNISPWNRTYKAHLEHVLKEIGWNHLLEGK